MQDHRAGHAHELLLPARKLVRKQIFFAHDVKTIQSVAHQADAFFMRHVLVRQRHLEIFEHRQIVDEVVALKHEADIGFVQLVAFLVVQLMNGLTKKKYSPFQALSSMPMILSSEDLPAPEGPMMVTNSPC